jgi:hypothetical protein
MDFGRRLIRTHLIGILDCHHLPGAQAVMLLLKKFPFFGGIGSQTFLRRISINNFY